MDKQQSTDRRKAQQTKVEIRRNGGGSLEDLPGTKTTKGETTMPAQGQKQDSDRASRDDWQKFGELYTQVGYHLSLPEVEKKGGLFVLPLGFVPKQTVMVGFTPPAKEGEEVKVTLLGGYGFQGEFPQGQVALSQTPPWFQETLSWRRGVIKSLDGDLTPFTEPAANLLKQGKPFKGFLRMAFFTFKQQMGREERKGQFGVCLVVEENMVKVVKVYDPENKFGVKEGDSFPLAWFGQGWQHPVPHIVATWYQLGAACWQAKNPAGNHR